MASSVLLIDEHDEYSEEEELLPPPMSWFGEQSLSLEDTTDSIPPMMEISAVTEPDSPPRLAWAVGAPRKAPSWKELSSQVLPAAAQELLSTSMRRVVHTARISYSRGRWHRRYSDLGSNVGGYFRTDAHDHSPDLPPFSSLVWVDRQLVQEWRTVSFDSSHHDDDDDDEDLDFHRARTLVPQPHPRPPWQKADVCHACHKPFGPTLLRHHCRLCGNSYCHTHSAWGHRLPHLGYDPDVPERVCDPCKRLLAEQNLAERVAWRLARCRDYFASNLTPYFETGVDTVEEVALRITKAAITMARSIPLGAQAHVAVETVEVLRKHGLKGIYGLILRKEFLAAADLLCRALGINKTAWPLSVHELSAAIFYALAQHRAMRGINPDREHLIHTFRRDNHPVEQDDERHWDNEWSVASSSWTQQSPKETLAKIREEDGDENDDDPDVSTFEKWDSIVSENSVLNETDTYDEVDHPVADNLAITEFANKSQQQPVGPSVSHLDPYNNTEELAFVPVCDPVSNEAISSLLFYAPIALNFIYVTREVDMQLLAAQQGWRLLYAHLQQDSGDEATISDRPASALFVHHEQRIACFAVRGTTTINDVVTDIRQMPVPFPETESDILEAGGNARFDEDWTPICRGQGLAVCGMAKAAVNLYRENIDALVLLARNGYRIRITGHSLGGGVATLLGALVLRHIEQTEHWGDFQKEDEKDGTTDGNAQPMAVERNDLLRVYGYGTPSCVDSKLSDYVKSFVTTVVLHDDVIPRLTPTSIRGLLKHLLHIRETWVKVHLADDLRAITDRAKTAWAPRWRGSFTLGGSSLMKRYCRKQIQYGKRKLLSVKGKLVSNGEQFEKKEGDEARQDERDSISVWQSMDSPCLSDPVQDGSDTKWNENEPSEDTFEKEQVPSELGMTMLVDFMGGVDNRTEGIVIDGDKFFDTEETLVESDDEVSTDLSDNYRDVNYSSNCCEDQTKDPFCGATPEEISAPAAEDDSWVPFDEPVENRLSGSQSGSDSVGSEADGLEEEDGPEAVMLEETPLPRMFLPGRIVHVYSHRGGYRAAFVPRAFRELRRISLAGNMLSDHTTKAYYEALLEVQTVRCAPEGLPRWTAFDEDMTCSCCASRFTWASTSDSEAQEARDKHNCRSCGTLVCDPCSKNRMPLPSVGLTVAVRVCDRCYNDLGGVLTGHSWHAMTSSFVAVDDHRKIDGSDTGCDEEINTPNDSLQDGIVVAADVTDQRPERQRDRRSLVVDELASRIHSTVSCS